MINVLVLCGGRSSERDVSCVSAAAVIRNMPAGYRPLLVRISPEGLWQFQAKPLEFANHPKPWTYKFDKVPARFEMGPLPALIVKSRSLSVDCVFPALHGPMGEDGTLQGLLEFVGLPYVGAGVLASAAGMDKEVTKRLALQAKIPVLPYVVLRSPSEAAKARKLRLPVFVKPSRQGSSVGVYKVKKPSELLPAIKKSFRYDTVVLVEQGIEAREIEVAVLGDAGSAAASIVGEIRPKHEFYSYEAKYEDPEGAELIVPAKLTKAQSDAVRSLALKAFDALAGEGLARVDFLMDKKTGKLWFNELNTLPGFTAISMYPKLWAETGLPFPKLVGELIESALRRFKRKARLRITRD